MSQLRRFRCVALLECWQSASAQVDLLIQARRPYHQDESTAFAHALSINRSPGIVIKHRLLPGSPAFVGVSWRRQNWLDLL
ncbi:hypothetical protein BC834DRAFT_236942 [Gloeopeniophorella convolvens]|nr:hypothetical protein BC834DRAFT_236942 [Gloeopeniophorella convolvens]